MVDSTSLKPRHGQARARIAVASVIASGLGAFGLVFGIQPTGRQIIVADAASVVTPSGYHYWPIPTVTLADATSAATPSGYHYWPIPTVTLADAAPVVTPNGYHYWPIPTAHGDIVRSSC